MRNPGTSFLLHIPIWIPSKRPRQQLRCLAPVFIWTLEVVIPITMPNFVRALFLTDTPRKRVPPIPLQHIKKKSECVGAHKNKPNLQWVYSRTYIRAAHSHVWIPTYIYSKWARVYVSHTAAPVTQTIKDSVNICSKAHGTKLHLDWDEEEHPFSGPVPKSLDSNNRRKPVFLENHVPLRNLAP